MVIYGRLNFMCIVSIYSRLSFDFSISTAIELSNEFVAGLTLKEDIQLTSLQSLGNDGGYDNTNFCLTLINANAGSLTKPLMGSNMGIQDVKFT